MKTEESRISGWKAKADHPSYIGPSSPVGNPALFLSIIDNSLSVCERCPVVPFINSGKESTMVGEMIDEMVGARTYLSEHTQKDLMRFCMEGLQLQGAEVMYVDDGRWLELLYFLTYKRFVSGDAYHNAVTNRIMDIGEAMLAMHLSIRTPVTSLPSPHALGVVVQAADEWEARRNNSAPSEDRDRIVSEVNDIFYRDGEDAVSLLTMAEELKSTPGKLLELAKQVFLGGARLMS